MLGKIGKYTWSILYNLISIAIMVVLFNSAKTTFETCVIYMLVNIYLTAGSRAFALVMSDFIAYKSNHKLLIEVAEKLNIETTELRKELKDNETTIEGGKPYLDLVFTSIKHFIALAYLISAL